MWIPTQGLRWQYQLQGKLKTNLCVVPHERRRLRSTQRLRRRPVRHRRRHAQHRGGGRHPRHRRPRGLLRRRRHLGGLPSRRRAYPASVKGLSNGWPGERWLDIRATAVLLPIITRPGGEMRGGGLRRRGLRQRRRVRRTPPGSPSPRPNSSPSTRISPPWRTRTACRSGSRTTSDQLGQLESTFDFAVNEQCAQYNECDAYDGWTAAGKAVVEVEYHAKPARYCPSADAAPPRRHPKELGPDGQARGSPAADRRGPW